MTAQPAGSESDLAKWLREFAASDLRVAPDSEVAQALVRFELAAHRRILAHSMLQAAKGKVRAAELELRAVEHAIDEADREHTLALGGLRLWMRGQR